MILIFSVDLFSGVKGHSGLVVPSKVINSDFMIAYGVIISLTSRLLFMTLNISRHGGRYNS